MTKDKSNWADRIVTGATIVGAIIFGRFFGFAGIGAAVAGWFVYTKLKNKNFLLAIIVGIISGIIAYFILVFILFSVVLMLLYI